MTTRFEKERTKQIQDKCQDVLSQMLRDEDNKYCVDCDAKGPRWASWNLGIFLCIRCAGIHRNLGVHISKVKSVNLDTWTPEQVVSLQQMGNSRARAVYEANLPNAFRRPQSDCSLESFIRAKYEHKKYIAREWVPSPIPKVNWDKEFDEEAEKLRKKKKEGLKTNANQNSLPPVKKPEVVPQLPKPQSSASPRPSRVSNTNSSSNSSINTSSNNNSATLDLLGLDAPATATTQSNTNGSSSNDDIFSSFLSATPATTASTTGTTNGTVDTSGASKADEESFFNQPAPTPQEKSKMTKDSILALYGTQTQQPSVFGIPSSGVYNQQQTLPNIFTQSMPNVTAFGQQNSFINQNSLGQMNHQIPAAVHQMAVPINNQMNLNPNQIGMMTAPGNIQMGPINQINSLPNPSMAMQASMMLQMGQNNIATNTNWNGMLAAQNIQPAPGNNPFFNLATQTPANSAFSSQLPQQMSQMSLDGLGKATPAGQTLSTNLWQ